MKRNRDQWKNNECITGVIVLGGLIVLYLLFH